MQMSRWHVVHYTIKSQGTNQTNRVNEFSAVYTCTGTEEPAEGHSGRIRGLFLYLGFVFADAFVGEKKSSFVSWDGYVPGKMQVAKPRS